MSVEAGGPERRRVGLGCRVDVGAPLRQQPHDVGVAGGGGAPQRRRALDRLAVEGDGAGLLHVRVAPLQEVLDDLAVAVAAGEHERRRAVRLGRHQLLDLVPRPVLQEDLQNGLDEG